MSRGPGRIQQEIAALIASNPDGAWLTADLCEHIYGLVEKKHRVAVTRAIRQMELPLSWKWNRGCLYNANSRESTKLHFMMEGCHNLELIERALVTIYGWSPTDAPETPPGGIARSPDRRIQAALARSWWHLTRRRSASSPFAAAVAPHVVS